MSEHVAVGYLLVRRVPRRPWMRDSLLPEWIISASTCICPRFPSTVALEWVSATADERSKELEEAGLHSEKYLEAVAWATEEFEKSFGWPGVFYSAEGALDARERFFSGSTEHAVVGLGLPRKYSEAFAAETTPREWPAKYAPEGESGYRQAAKEFVALEPKHRPVGYELLNVQVGQICCSWLCNGIENDCAESFGIEPGEAGLLPTLQSAEQCLRAVTSGEIGAEPGSWYPFLLAAYD